MTLHNDPSRMLFMETNVESTEPLRNAINNTLHQVQLTKKPLGGVVCCVGFGGPARVLPQQKPDATHDALKYFDFTMFDRVLAVNLRGLIDLIRLTVPHLFLNEPSGPDGKRGVVVMGSSVAAFEGQVGQLSYKGAVCSIVLPLARELGPRRGFV
ncbi:trifunctional histidinol dehydrogenase [Sporothrix eucalyptigena]|uniref:Trifunctional histidinol dehydrogenase n=1 Tax=Sporothrix eucalyptigena TaxID=1812306 RepID=A0ABP0BXZ3_9PEZI